MRSYSISFLLYFSVLASLLLTPLQIQAQTITKSTLTGRIYDAATGEELPGVSVTVRGKRIGTASDINGHYSLHGVFTKGDTISYSFIGMVPDHFIYDGSAAHDVAMTPDKNTLKEVTVSAQSNINALDIRARSGVVETVDMHRLNEKPMIDMSLALQGAVPGLIVTNAGDLGSKPTIRIRGNSSLRTGDAANEPLYVLDGKVISSDAFMTLNPQDIREIKVLKDAAATALYGIKAANGVIEISSQRGSHFGNTDVSYTFGMGVTLPARRGITTMNSTEKLELERLMKNVAAPGYRYSADYYRTMYPNNPNLNTMIAEGEAVLDSLRSINTDWYKELMRTSLYQRHNLSLRGGNEKTSYFAAANYSQQGGAIRGNDTKRFTMRLGIEQALGKIGFLSLDMDGGYSITDSPNGSSFSPGSLVYNLNPYETPDKGKLWSYPNRTYRNLENQYSSSSSDKRGGVSGSFNLRPVEELEVSGVAGIDYLLTENTQFTPASSYSEQNSGFPKEQLGRLSKSKNTVANISSNIRVVYNKVFADRHDLTLSANSDYYLTSVDNIGMTGYGVGDHATASLINQSIEGSRKPSVSSLKEKTAQIGVGTVAGYTYNHTYDLFATYKADGSSVLPAGRRWNSAWALGASWTPTEYGFLNKNGWLNHLNLRGSFGRTASLAGVSASAQLATFAYAEDTYATQRLLQLLALYNTGLEPEHTTSIDLGLKTRIFRCLNLDVQWYRRQTADALLDVPVAASNGFNMMKRNIGTLRNDGIEVSASCNVIDNDDFRLRIGASVAYNKNKVVDLYYTDKLYTSEYALLPDFMIGEPYDILYGLQWGGINSITGLPVFIGKDGREIEPGKDALTRDDFVRIGHTTPPYSGTINLSASYGNLDLDIDFYGVAGGVRQYEYTYVRNRDNANMNAIAGLTDKMWFQRGDMNKTYYSPFYSSSAIETLAYANTHNTGKSDYLRMSMLSLRYRLPASILNKTHNFVKYANVALQASNLFTITPYDESDPETGMMGAGMQRVITLNLTLTF